MAVDAARGVEVGDRLFGAVARGVVDAPERGERQQSARIGPGGQSRRTVARENQLTFRPQHARHLCDRALGRVQPGNDADRHDEIEFTCLEGQRMHVGE